MIKKMTLRTVTQLLVAINTVAAIVLAVSSAGIAMSWGIHEVLDGQTLITLISVCCAGLIVNVIPK